MPAKLAVLIGAARMLGEKLFFQTESLFNLQLKASTADVNGGRPSYFHMPIMRSFIESRRYLLCRFTLAGSPLAKVVLALSRHWRMLRQRPQSAPRVKLTRTDGLAPSGHSPTDLLAAVRPPVIARNLAFAATAKWATGDPTKRTARQPSAERC
jgi:hypothetical protein